MGYLQGRCPLRAKSPAGKISRLLKRTYRAPDLPVAVGIFFISSSSAWAEKRVALVIGISKYQSVPRLANPAWDAEAMSALFRKAGFDVVESGQACAGLIAATVSMGAASLLHAETAGVCVYDSKSYTEGASICPRQSLMLSCRLEGAQMVWTIVADRDATRLCSSPAIPRFHKRPIRRVRIGIAARATGGRDSEMLPVQWTNLLRVGKCWARRIAVECVAWRWRCGFPAPDA